MALLSKLTEKQKRFADEYLIDLNATRAYKAAYTGVKKDDAAAVNSSKLLRNTKVLAYIEERQKDLQKRTEITQDKVLKELAAIGFSNGSDFAKVIEKVATDNEGNPLIDKETGEIMKYRTIDLVLTDNLPEEKKKALAGIKYGKYGISVEMCDKIKALELIGRHLGMFTDKLQVDNSATVQIVDDIKLGDEDA